MVVGVARAVVHPVLVLAKNPEAQVIRVQERSTLGAYLRLGSHPVPE